MNPASRLADPLASGMSDAKREFDLWFDETSGFTGDEEEVAHDAFMAGWDAAIAKYEAKHNDDIYGKKVEK
jgi:hypothetical protein